MRQPKPWFRASKQAWYVEHRGRQHHLGEQPEGAPHPKKSKGVWNAPQSVLDAFYKLMASDPTNLPKAGQLYVCQVCDLFLSYSQKHHKPETYRWYKAYLQDFCERYGRLPAKDLIPLHVSAWLDDHANWKGSRRCAVIAVKRAFNWADAEGVLSPNPIKRVKKPAARRRDRILSKEERLEILSAIKDHQFRDFFFALTETGARPSEVGRVTAENVNLELGVWAFSKHKTAEKTGKPRIIYLTEPMVELTRRLMREHPEGPLFRGPRGGRPYTKNGIRCRFKRLRERLPHLKHFVCYNLRHTFATEALAKGVGVAQVAELMGHEDLSMIQKHYGHLSQQLQQMREAAKRAAS
jgi:integrase/recombinase XerD